MTYSHAILVHPGSLCGSAHWHKAVTADDLDSMWRELSSVPRDCSVHLVGDFENELRDYPTVAAMVDHCSIRVSKGSCLRAAVSRIPKIAGITCTSRVRVLGAWGELSGCARFVADFVREKTGALVSLARGVPRLVDESDYELSDLQTKVAERVGKSVRASASTKLVKRFGFGPFDGGCFLLAAASRSLIGGGQFVLLHSEAGPQHFVLRIGPDSFLDGFGISTSTELSNQLRRKEGLDITRWEYLEQGSASSMAASLTIPASPQEVAICVDALRSR